jgi:hypothetical protein
VLFSRGVSRCTWGERGGGGWRGGFWQGDAYDEALVQCPGGSLVAHHVGGRPGDRVACVQVAPLIVVALLVVVLMVVQVEGRRGLLLHL